MTEESHTIGGTDAAAIVCQRFGVPYFGRSAWDAYLRWSGQAPARGPRPAYLDTGLRLEPMILDWYVETQRTGWDYVNDVYRNLRIETATAHGSIDGLLVRPLDDHVVVDAKRAVLRVDEWGTDADPRTPIGYQVQLAWYGLLVEETRGPVLACDLAIYDPLRDASGQDPWAVRSHPWADLRGLALEWRALVEEEVALWEAGQQPPWDGSDAAQRWLAVHAAPPRGSDREARIATNEEAELVRAWRGFAATRDEAEVRIAHLVSRLVDARSHEGA